MKCYPYLFYNVLMSSTFSLLV